jgi:hypothetical protein
VVEEYLTPDELAAITGEDRARLATVFDALRMDIAYQNEPEKLRRLARTIVALYKGITKDTDKLVEILRHPVP